MQIKHRPGTQDIHVWRDVLVRNEYRLPDKFLPTDRIIDIGAHIGVFAIACVARGAEKIECYEPDPDNFSILVENLPVHCKARNLAVYQSGHEARAMVWSGYSKGYNACGYIVAEVANDKEPFCLAVGLDEIINKEPVRLLKLDCEGAEFPIILTSKDLSYVHEIVGEVHAMTYETKMGDIYTTDLFDCLEDQGFTVEKWKVNHKGRSQVCNFSAKRWRS